MGAVTATGQLKLAKIGLNGVDPNHYLRYALPQEDLSDEVNHWRWKNQGHYLETLEPVILAWFHGIATFYGSLYLAKIDANGDLREHGLVGHYVVTTAGVNKIIAFMDKADTSTGQNWLYHGIGKGTTAEAAGNTGLATELTTEYATPNSRPAGSQGVGATNNVYRTAATVAVGTVGSAQVITEHGVFSASAVGSGTLLDRSMFSGSSISLNSNEAIAAQYDFTLTAGG